MDVRRQMLRSLRHTSTCRQFSHTARRRADVELTVDGRKVSVPGTFSISLPSPPPHQHPSAPGLPVVGVA